MQHTSDHQLIISFEADVSAPPLKHFQNGARKYIIIFIMLVGIRTGSTRWRNHEADFPTIPAVALFVIWNNSTLDAVNKYCASAMGGEWVFFEVSPYNLVDSAVLALAERCGALEIYSGRTKTMVLERLYVEQEHI